MTESYSDACLLRDEHNSVWVNLPPDEVGGTAVHVSTGCQRVQRKKKNQCSWCWGEDSLKNKYLIFQNIHNQWGKLEPLECSSDVLKPTSSRVNSRPVQMLPLFLLSDKFTLSLIVYCAITRLKQAEMERYPANWLNRRAVTSVVTLIQPRSWDNGCFVVKERQKKRCVLSASLLEVIKVFLKYSNRKCFDA